jgi:hypothetical protein
MFPHHQKPNSCFTNGEERWPAARSQKISELVTLVPIPKKIKKIKKRKEKR